MVSHPAKFYVSIAQLPIMKALGLWLAILEVHSPTQRTIVSSSLGPSKAFLHRMDDMLVFDCISPGDQIEHNADKLPKFVIIQLAIDY